MASTATPLTLDILRETPEFKQLTSYQKRFVELFIESGDAKQATRGAYPKRAYDERYIAMLAQKNLNSPAVIAVLDLHAQRDSRLRFLLSLERTIQHSKGIAKIQAQELYAKLAFGYDADEASEVFEAGSAPAASTKGKKSAKAVKEPPTVSSQGYGDNI